MLYYSHLNRYAAELNRGNRDRGVLDKLLCGEAPPRGPTPNPFVIFHKKGIPFVYLLLTNSTSFTYLF